MLMQRLRYKEIEFYTFKQEMIKVLSQRHVI